MPKISQIILYIIIMNTFLKPFFRLHITDFKISAYIPTQIQIIPIYQKPDLIIFDVQI